MSRHWDLVPIWKKILMPISVLFLWNAFGKTQDCESAAPFIWSRLFVSLAGNSSKEIW